MEAYDHFHEKLPGMRGKNLLGWLLLAYNTGPGSVEKSLKAGLDVDKTTACGDYSRNVMGGAVVFQRQGFDG
jgi:hypothetical protein